MEYEAKIKPTRKVLYIREVSAQPVSEEERAYPSAEGRLRIELKPDVDEYEIEYAIKQLADIVEQPVPLSFTVSEEADVEVKAEREHKRGKRQK